MYLGSWYVLYGWVTDNRFFDLEFKCKDISHVADILMSFVLEESDNSFIKEKRIWYLLLQLKQNLSIHLIQQTLLGAYTLQATSANNTHQTSSASTITKHTTSTRTPHSTSTLDGNQINTLWTLNQGTHWSVTAPIKLIHLVYHKGKNVKLRLFS